MSGKVIKLILVADEDTSGMIIDYAELPLKAREDSANEIAFVFTDKNEIDHELHFVHAEEV